MVSTSSPMTAAMAAAPTGPEPNFWTMAASSRRSVVSRPRSSMSMAAIAALAWCAVIPASDGHDRLGLDGYAQDACGATHDLRQLILRVVLQAVDGAEAVAQWG